MSYTYPISDPGAMHFITCTVVQWQTYLPGRCMPEMVEDSLTFCIEKKGLLVYGSVMMSNHIHLLMQAKDNNLSDVRRDFKKFTSAYYKSD